MKKHRRSSEEVLVTLTRVPHRWGKLPVTMKRSIVAGVDRTRRIRLDIAQKALVNAMPPVRVLDVAWVAPGYTGAIHGRSTTLKIGAAFQFGVELAAPTVVYADDTALRGVLLHEFSHCFNAARRILEHLDAGGGNTFQDSDPTRSLFSDEEYDRKRLDPPEFWFCSEDVAIFPYWHSRLLDQCTDRIATEWILRGLPSIVPPTGYAATNLAIPEPWVERIRS